jgi:threonine dehydrogenase-like Zn-dependent dehydrogenase
MRQLTYIRPGVLEWWDVLEPQLEADTDALVRPFVAARCDGDSFFLKHRYPALLGWGACLHLVDASFRDKKNNPFLGPFAYGHEGVAEVVSCGSAVQRFKAGQRVVVPWAISCGQCAPCRAGLTSNCASNSTPLGAYGFGEAFGRHGGMLSDSVRVPNADFMLVAVPAGVDPLQLASASDNLSDAYRTVAGPLQRRPGAAVLVLGGAAKSIGLYAAGIAVALGASRVDYVDGSTTRLGQAASLGANPVELRKGSPWFKRGEPPKPGGYGVTVDASSTTAGLAYALRVLAPGGVCTGVGFYVRRGTPLPLWGMYFKSATLHVGLSHPRADIPGVVSLVERGSLRPEKVLSCVADWTDAPQALLERSTKVALRRTPLFA